MIGNGGRGEYLINWFLKDCVKFRKPTVAPAEVEHRSVTPGHLAHVSAALGRPLRWNPDTEVIPGDEEAMRLLTAVEYREPWIL